MRRVALELGRQVGADERRAPAELDDVHVGARDLEQPIDLGDRQAAVDHVRDAALARLDRARGDVQEVGYLLAPGALTSAVGRRGVDQDRPTAATLRRPAPALSRPAITTTVELPASGDTAASIGCT